MACIYVMPSGYSKTDPNCLYFDVKFKGHRVCVVRGNLETGEAKMQDLRRRTFENQSTEPFNEFLERLVNKMNDNFDLNLEINENQSL